MSGKIGLLYPNLNKRGRYEVNDAYINYFKKFGELEAVVPYEPFNPNLKALVLSGGADINPLRYGEYPTYSGDPNLEYDYFDQFILPQYIEANIPIIGVCRGLQSLVVHYGGKLNQHVTLPSSSKGDFRKQHINFGSRGRLVENLKFTSKYSYLSSIPGFTTEINSLHHQTASLKDLPKEIKPIAFSKEYGNLELATVDNKNILMFQGHMEELENTKLFDHLIKNTINGKLANWN